MYPKVRFRGFDESWRTEKLKNIGESFSGLSGKKSSDFGHGEAKYITYLNILNNPIIDTKLTDKIEIDNKQHLVKKGDIFFTISSETPQEVGLSSVLDTNLNECYLNSFSFGYRLKEISMFDNLFNSYNFRSPNFRRKMYILAQGISRYNISKKAVLNETICFPKISEQKQIGKLIKLMNSLLSLQQRKLELISALEKGLGQIIKQQNNKYGITFSLNNFLEIPPQIQARIKNKNQLLTVKLNLQGIARGVQRDTLSLGSTKYFIRHTGELIFGKQNIFNGSIALITKEFDGLATSNDVPSLKISNINPQFLFYLLKNPDFWKHTELIATGTGSKRVHIHDLLKLHIKIIPDAKYQAKIVSLSRNFEKIVLNQQIIVKECEKTKQFLLQNLFI
ncbi:restriction endonuclease subunit S [Lactobacillus jensenii]|uniref:restriction endonuclease subunit S n=2 Tax=Lactobacillus jensenii TaxID=109790 RepID=UPI00119626DE|nr:restriction endonuclease subunit S [Lactobacillus jensenii]MDK7295884.1 restriction endonuclease subunit S [Lactobacillus jensenii]TVV14159.1 restriction endonuclease subunit S [Lactobacillus jensenii]